MVEMIQASKDLGPVGLNLCMDKCRKLPRCTHFTFNVAIHLCLFFVPPMTFEKVDMDTFISGSRDCLIAMESAANGSKKNNVTAKNDGEN